ncbi:hypothetical protein [Siccirubricoccus sp. G192]|uniref:hypothetical protein n=1 Tax=Siccirubricoccus sp. G192 TaxID=2849651 RepID=UPI001C2C96FC|nr:hypothetical protein [Siccirubricoccus sp. G192]MBV1797531.1 hypothetical protein [Siccirubricoccus sp. G192]
MRERIGQALAAGIAPERIVPVFQAFGQSCTTSAPGYQRLPTEDEARAMLAVWDELVPPRAPPFRHDLFLGAAGPKRLPEPRHGGRP